jgi:hypothetical protein
MKFREFLDACKFATRSDATFVWIPQQFLHDHGLETDVALKTFSGISRSGDRIRTTKDCIASAAARRFRQAGTRPFEETALDC